MRDLLPRAAGTDPVLLLLCWSRAVLAVHWPLINQQCRLSDNGATVFIACQVETWTVWNDVTLLPPLGKVGRPQEHATTSRNGIMQLSQLTSSIQATRRAAAPRHAVVCTATLTKPNNSLQLSK